MEVLLSIITITKNDPKGLAHTLQSVGGFRSFRNVEHWVVDGSDDEIYLDNSKKALEMGAYIIQSSPKGVAAAFNEGLQKINGQWVWFLNGGDVFNSELRPDEILRILTLTTSQLLFFRIQYTPSGNSPDFPPIWMLWPNMNLWAPHPSSFVRREVFLTEGGFNENNKFCMDYDFWNRVFNEKYTVNLISIPIVDFDETGISTVNELKVRKEARRIKWVYFFKTFKLLINKFILLIKTY